MRKVPLLVLALAACRSNNALNTRPSFVKGAIVTMPYDGSSDDLLTGGLGKSGLAFVAPAPGFINAASPTAAELRRLAIYQNYRALVDTTATGGYGVLYGPNIDAQGGNTLGEGKIAGEETLAFDDDGTGRVNASMMVQVPASFDVNNPCIVTDKMADGDGSPTVYYEVDNAQHFDAFLPFVSLATRYVPLHPYVIQSLDLMYARLKNGTALPPSQLVRTTPRSSPFAQISATNVPPISGAPAAADLITFVSGTVSVP